MTETDPKQSNIYSLSLWSSFHKTLILLLPLLLTERSKNYFSQEWKTVLHCFSIHSSKQQNVKFKKHSLTATVRFGLKYNLTLIYFRSTSVCKVFFSKLSFPKVILYLHLSALNKLLPSVFLVITIYLHFVTDNTFTFQAQTQALVLQPSGTQG